ncbi:hypothetical protein AB0F96_29895 [Streptomyces sp. NPDC023998]
MSGPEEISRAEDLVERVPATDIAKASGMVFTSICTRWPGSCFS